MNKPKNNKPESTTIMRIPRPFGAIFLVCVFVPVPITAVFFMWTEYSGRILYGDYKYYIHKILPFLSELGQIFIQLIFKAPLVTAPVGIFFCLYFYFIGRTINIKYRIVSIIHYSLVYFIFFAIFSLLLFFVFDIMIRKKDISELFVVIFFSSLVSGVLVQRLWQRELSGSRKKIKNE